jgi:hypothetical protein
LGLSPANFNHLFSLPASNLLLPQRQAIKGFSSKQAQPGSIISIFNFYLQYLLPQALPAIFVLFFYKCLTPLGSENRVLKN